MRQRARRPAEMKEKPPRELFRELALFRHKLRTFLRFSERAARAAGITPQQHQLMLGIAGFTGTGKVNISEIAAFLQERHNSVVGLVDRAAQSGLVRRAEDPEDRRVVVVSLTARGEKILKALSLLHHEELQRLRRDFLGAENAPKRGLPAGQRKKPVRDTQHSTR